MLAEGTGAMAEDEDFDDQLLDVEPMPEDLEEEDLDLGADDELDEEDLEDPDLDVAEADEADVEDVGAESDVLIGDEDEDYEDEEDEDSDDVEASLDVILKSRLVVSDDEDEEDDEEEEEDDEADDRGETASRVLPKQPGEFVCRSCFLVKNQSQLADRERELCRDCV
jgi:hypothetical protein